MFKISFSPQYSTAVLSIEKRGGVLIVNGDELDFSDLPDGGDYPAEAIENPMVVGGVKRVDGEVHIAVLLPYSKPNPPRSVAFPDTLTVASDGEITLPEGRIAPSQNEQETDDAAE